MGTVIVDAVHGISDATFVGVWAVLWLAVVLGLFFALGDN